jgi:hypothetical protein
MKFLLSKQMHWPGKIFGRTAWRKFARGLSHILHGAIKPQDNSSSSTLYFKFRVDPISDAVSKSDAFYLAGLTLFADGAEHLAVGSGRISWGYSAFNASGKGPENTIEGEFALHSATPEAGRIFQYVRRGIRTIIVFKVQYVPGQNAHVTVWLNPDLSLGATENNQPTNITTRFEANATFNEIHLVHQGGGGGGILAISQLPLHLTIF